MLPNKCNATQSSLAQTFLAIANMRPSRLESFAFLYVRLAFSVVAVRRFSAIDIGAGCTKDVLSYGKGFLIAVGPNRERLERPRGP